MLIEGNFGFRPTIKHRRRLMPHMGTACGKNILVQLRKISENRSNAFPMRVQLGRQACERVLPHLARKLFVRVGVLSDGEAPDDCKEEVLREIVEAVA